MSASRVHNVGGQLVLPFPPPTACDACGQPSEPFASTWGWRCWTCLPDEERRDEDGKELAEPIVTAKDRADLTLIRDRLSPNASRCDWCRELRGADELYGVDGRWMCCDCSRRAGVRIREGRLEKTGVSGVSEGENALGPSIVGAPMPNPCPHDSPSPETDVAGDAR